MKRRRRLLSRRHRLTQAAPIIAAFSLYLDSPPSGFPLDASYAVRPVTAGLTELLRGCWRLLLTLISR